MISRHVSDQLTAYSDRELPSDTRSRVGAHLSRCERCRLELDEVILTQGVLRRAPVVTAPEGLWAAIETAVDRRQDPHVSAWFNWRYAAVAALLVIASAAFWRLPRHPPAEWEVVALEGTPTAGSKPISARETARTGDWIQTNSESRLRIKIGDIGSVEVQPDTRVRLVETGSSGYRLALGSGGIKAVISAPPRLFFVETPAGIAVDLGCEYDIHCDRDGNGLLRVSAGWVSFEREGRESLVPAGASCRMRAQLAPGTPYFDDAPPRLVQAVEKFDFTPDAEKELDTILSEARPRDTLTLWHLLSRVRGAVRPQVYERMAALAPPPPGVTRDGVLRLEQESLVRWKNELAWIW